MKKTSLYFRLTRTFVNDNGDEWISLVSEQGRSAGPTSEAVEEEVADCLLELLVAVPEPSSALRAYADAALDYANGQRLLRPGVLARKALSQGDRPSSTVEFCLAAVNHAVALDPKALSFGTSREEESTEGLDVVAQKVLPAVLDSPTSTSQTQRWLLRLVRRAMQASKQAKMDNSASERYREGLQSILRQLDTTEKEDLGSLKKEIQEQLSRSSPRGRRRAPAVVNVDESGLSRRGTDPDAALYCSDLLLHPHTPTDSSAIRLAGLLRYRTDHVAFRGSDSEQAASLLLAEVIGAMIWALHTAARHDFLLESLVYAKFPSIVKACKDAGSLHATSEVLSRSLEMTRTNLETVPKQEMIQPDEGVATGSTYTLKTDPSLALISASPQRVWDHLVFAFCQQGLLSSAEGTKLVPAAEPADLEPAMATNVEDKLTSRDPDVLRAALEEHLHSFGSQPNLAQAMATTFRERTQSGDITGLANLCEVLMAHNEELSVIFLHVEPSELLEPVRQLLDATDPSQDDTNDSSVMERYGMLVLFLQITVERFELGHDLAKHLGSTTSFFVSWLRASSAVYALPNISEEERHAVGGWIGALFGEGISDDLMHATNPKILLKIAPTILKQSLMACRASVVDQDSLRDALSYFLQELLRFTLPGVLVWLLTEIEQTPALNAKKSMIDILLVFCLSESLPPAVLELVAPYLARTIRRGGLSSLEPSERLKLLKLIAPYRPSNPVTTWVDQSDSSSLRQASPPLADVLTPSDTATPFRLTASHREVALALRRSSCWSNEDVLRVCVDVLMREDPNEGHQLEALLRYGRVERAGAALMAWRPHALEDLVRSVSSPSADEGSPGTSGERRSRRLALLADILGGAITLADENQHRRLIGVLRPGSAQTGVAANSSSELWERLQSWPAISASV
ncbi:hypothetical protein JCM10908_006188 [Rhodotorula pacifica]|uniref:uncharacterized protein n=1 Tax=Rhodotorula pacifica TaxID=1495444 RepID=UPI00317D10C7